jgi:hypothetical protein
MVPLSNTNKMMVKAIIDLGVKIGEDPKMTAIMLGHLLDTRSGALLDLELRETLVTYHKLAAKVQGA